MSIGKRAFRSYFKPNFHGGLARIVAGVQRGHALDPGDFRAWERRGYHLTPVHFYYPIPDTRELSSRPYPDVSQLPGIDLRADEQLELLRGVFPRYRDEYGRLPAQGSISEGFYLANDYFSGIDPLVYYCMIRHFQPSMIVEIGSGYSTLLAAQANARNGATRHIVVDPWPREFIAKGMPGAQLLRRRVEELDLALFRQLQPNDILFVDSSHVVRTAGDVCFLLLEVLPRLAGGVIVHFHDIFLPYEYPREWLVRPPSGKSDHGGATAVPEGKHYFWTEQYLLQAYLIGNRSVEVLFANNYMVRDHLEAVQGAFPGALAWSGSSFWIRTGEQSHA